MQATSVFKTDFPSTNFSNTLPATPQPAPPVLVVKTNDLREAGLWPGDQLLLAATTPAPGQLLVIRLDGKLLLRRLERTSTAWLLVPLQPRLASLEWPLHLPLPLVGVVQGIQRRL